MRKFTLNIVIAILFTLVGMSLFIPEASAATKPNTIHTPARPNTTGACEVTATLTNTVYFNTKVLNSVGHVVCTFKFANTKIAMELQHCGAEAFGTCFWWDDPVPLEDCSNTTNSNVAVCARNYEDLKSGLWQLTVTSVTITYDGEENDGWDYSTTRV